MLAAPRRRGGNGGRSASSAAAPRRLRGPLHRTGGSDLRGSCTPLSLSPCCDPCPPPHLSCPGGQQEGDAEMPPGRCPGSGDAPPRPPPAFIESGARSGQCAQSRFGFLPRFYLLFGVTPWSPGSVVSRHLPDSQAEGSRVFTRPQLGAET